MPSYRVAGLQVASEIELPEAIAAARTVRRARRLWLASDGATSRGSRTMTMAASARLPSWPTGTPPSAASPDASTISFASSCGAGADTWQAGSIRPTFPCCWSATRTYRPTSPARFPVCSLLPAARRRQRKSSALFSDFAQLRQQEQEKGFREGPRPWTGGNFFRRGKAGARREELTAEQVARIEAAHAPMMRRLGYELATSAALARAG